MNFLLRSAQEQRSIIYSFISYLKIAPAKVQFKVLTKRADIDRHVETVRKELERETDPHCRLLQEDYLKLIRQLGSREAITRRFFLIFEHEPLPGTKRGHEEDEAVASLQTAARTATNYLRQCGNAVLSTEDEDNATAEILFHILCRRESDEHSFAEKAKQILAEYIAAGRSIDSIPSNEFYAPSAVDFSHGRYICIDGVYYAYLFVPSDGYKAQVPAGWLSLIVNAGDGIDMDMFLSRQPKDRMIRKLGQQLRINRSKIKEASDTNTDFDDLDGAIRSGYFLKDGLSNNEDFYYLNLLITVTADHMDDLEWKCAELKKLLHSQDMDVQPCTFCQEQAFLSSLPLVDLEHRLYDRSKRNVLTLGAASCYPFTSYEMCDNNGILLGVNKHNNSLTQTVVVNPNDTQTLYFYNTPIGGVEIIKVNEDNHSERIPNTTFEIRKVDDALVDTVTTDKNGRVFVALEDGSYYAKEVTSNKSFRLDDTPHYFEIKDGKHVTLQVTNKKLSGIVIHKIDSVTGEGIYGVKFVLYDANKKPIGEYTSDDEGYIYIDEIPGGLSGRFYLRELEAAPGYTLDKQYKTVYVSPGKTVELEWENTAVTGQIQIYKYAAEYNEVTGTAAGTPLKGAVYEIVNARSGKVVDYITTDARGVAASKALPLTRYQIREVTAPAYWQLDPTVHDVTLEYPGQIIKLSAYRGVWLWADFHGYCGLLADR